MPEAHGDPPGPTAALQQHLPPRRAITDRALPQAGLAPAQWSLEPPGGTPHGLRANSSPGRLCAGPLQICRSPCNSPNQRGTGPIIASVPALRTWGLGGSHCDSDPTALLVSTGLCPPRLWTSWR